MKLKGKNLFFIVCILFFVFLIIQHQAVFCIMMIMDMQFCHMDMKVIPMV